MKTRAAFTFAVLAVGLAQPGKTLADDSPWTFRGFGTLSMTRSSSRDADFVRDLSQQYGSHGQWTPKVDSDLGFQANWQISARFEAVAQVVSRYHLERSYDPEIHWAFLKYEFPRGGVVRLGRVGTEFYMESDSRLVGYSNTLVRPPPDFLGGLPFYYMDGADWTTAIPIAGGLLRPKVYVGQGGEHVPVGSGATWNLTGSQVVGGYLDYQRGDWQWRAGYTRVRFRQEFPTNGFLDMLRAAGAAAVADDLAFANKQARYYSAGLIYDYGPLRVQLMANDLEPGTAALFKTRSAYAVASYQSGVWTPYLGYSRVRSRFSTLETGDQALDAAVAAMRSLSFSNQHTSFVGIRWDFMRNMALKAQWDEIRGTPSSTWTLQNVAPGWQGRTNVLSLAVDFIY
jgi:hypothetical protein